MQKLEQAQKYGKPVEIRTPIAEGNRLAFYYEGKYHIMGSVRQGPLALEPSQVKENYQ